MFYFLIAAVDNLCAHDMLYGYGDSIARFGTPVATHFQTHYGLGSAVLLMGSTVSTEEVAGDGCMRRKEILRLIYCLRLALYTGG